MENFRIQQEQWESTNLCCLAKKSVEAKRWKHEEPDLYRTEYQRDVGRILFSDAFRRLRMKTQVFQASGTNQHDRTRLTHSLEVSQIARSISRPLGLNLDLTEAIALGHDLGHTPFGHAGENALNNCLEGIGRTFNHNVQSVWILRTTFCNRHDASGQKVLGFNLTHDVVEGVWKHTDYEHTVNEIDGLHYYNPNQCASLEGQVVDIADGIAYLQHDLDDAIRAKLIDEAEFDEVLKKYLDFPIDKSNWVHFLVYDVIQNSRESSIIDFSEDVRIFYKDVKKLIKEKVLNSDIVKSLDKAGEEKIKVIFDYYKNKPEYLLRKPMNRKKCDKYGIDRVLVDYIQWLGDENANELYRRIVVKMKE